MLSWHTLQITVQKENRMRILQTDCTPEEVQKDLPELERLNREAMQSEIMWEFFGGTITLENGHQYQVTGV
jgi:hypothetical protein